MMTIADWIEKVLTVSSLQKAAMICITNSEVWDLDKNGPIQV